MKTTERRSSGRSRSRYRSRGRSRGQSRYNAIRKSPPISDVSIDRLGQKVIIRWSTRRKRASRMGVDEAVPLLVLVLLLSTE